MHRASESGFMWPFDGGSRAGLVRSASAVFRSRVAVLMCCRGDFSFEGCVWMFRVFKIWKNGG